MFQLHHRMRCSQLGRPDQLLLQFQSSSQQALKEIKIINTFTSASKRDRATLSDLTATTYRTTPNSSKRSKRNTTLLADGFGSGCPHGATITASSFDSKKRAWGSALGLKSRFPSPQIHCMSTILSLCENASCRLTDPSLTMSFTYITTTNPAPLLSSIGNDGIMDR